ncbi:DJ-1/PfpI family protein [Pantoea dispersa]|uniref:DJ-1/PfpI family protein n=1 Tax=Pantoea dispersa TaxID=59814 RepID=UPI0028631F49|nr:DJ-1/PfpI family protein [Pantoea dispersa]MDR6295042.1 cyclohexyl-isocyanide hydratase [Pantoea dispersa]
MSNLFKVLIPIYNGVTQLDFTGPYQFFSRTPQFETILASVDGENVYADGMHFTGLRDLMYEKECDILCVPGGSGCTDAIENDRYMESIVKLAHTASYITSVCSGSLILGAAGLLSGKRAACHWAWRDQLSLFGAIPDEGRVVKDGDVITGGGVTAGIDFALVLIGELCGEDAAMQVQLGLEYAPHPPYEAGRPETAPAWIAAKLKEASATRVSERLHILENAARKISKTMHS